MEFRACLSEGMCVASLYEECLLSCMANASCSAVV